jgi:hypothetical protein
MSATLLLRVAALATIEGIDHPHSADIAIEALADADEDVRTAANPRASRVDVQGARDARARSP